MAEKSGRTLVMKFGGTSVGSAQAVLQAVKIIQDARSVWDRVVVVTSAIAGATNALVDSAASAAIGDLQPLIKAEKGLLNDHNRMAETLISDPQRLETVKKETVRLVTSFGESCRAIGVIGEASPRALDAVASHGERLSVRLLAAACQENGIDARFIESTHLVITNAHFQNAHPDFEKTTKACRAVLNPLLDAGVVPIVTGFIGATPEGVITTLGRGGSDYSASILGAVLPANDVWIWTDVDGVMTADPRIVPDAKTIPVISYGEMAELSYYGAKVLHPKAVRPVIEAGIGLRICNTFNPSNPGTRLVANNNNGKVSDKQKVIKAVSAIRGQKLIYIEGRGMLGVPGVAARAFGAVASTGTSVPLITQASSEQSICFAVPAEVANDVQAALQKVFAEEITNRDIDRIWYSHEVAILTIVGAGTYSTPGVAGLIFTKLGQAEINVLAIAQGSSPVSICIVVSSADGEKAVRALHELIVKQDSLAGNPPKPDGIINSGGDQPEAILGESGTAHSVLVAN